jgi:hypothetical protein
VEIHVSPITKGVDFMCLKLSLKVIYPRMVGKCHTKKLQTKTNDFTMTTEIFRTSIYARLIDKTALHKKVPKTMYSIMVDKILRNM